MYEPPYILIVDDEPIGRETLGEMLMIHKYQIEYASNGAQALTIVQKMTPDLILLDVMMPGLDGFAVCRQLKADGHSRHIPVILVTALDSKADMVRGIDAGADDFLHKPVNTTELRARVRSMLRIKRQYDALQETLTLREDMANMLVHDMRTPLTAILGLSELMQMDDVDIPPDQLQEDAKTIYLHALRLDSFINDMLMLAKMSAGELVLNQSFINLDELLKLVIQSHALSAQAKHITFVFQKNVEKDDKVWVDATLFQRVLDNLISNAVKFSPLNSTICVQTVYFTENTESDPGPRFMICISDEGLGVPEEHREAIFEKFKIVDPKNKKVSQYGLGLAFCKMVIDAHAGQIYMEPNEPRGAIFVIKI